MLHIFFRIWKRIPSIHHRPIFQCPTSTHYPGRVLRHLRQKFPSESGISPYLRSHRNPLQCFPHRQVENVYLVTLWTLVPILILMNAITQDLLIKLEMGKKKAIRLGKVMSPLKSEVKKDKSVSLHYRPQTNQGGRSIAWKFRYHFCQMSDENLAA